MIMDRMEMEWKWATDSEVSMGQQSRDDGFFCTGTSMDSSGPRVVQYFQIEKNIMNTGGIVLKICIIIKYSVKFCAIRQYTTIRLLTSTDF